uniref:NADH-ubiquinone oxidoreductase chain 6 n=1 Tax=Acanthodactylus guineensis TaxID=1855261 RepID=A0A8A3WRT5_9SAUR|nr:NADH dehydrogenase subunit 6 [Acanthodactylus guineensis]QTA72692.1 NADH dehydrogenase subunit 6 [Acanthodactylus guineensis]
MAYFVSLLLVCLMISIVGVASNPSAYFGAGSLVVAAVMGCGVLVVVGCSFVSIVLLLIYLGGMLVVFAYSVALSYDLFPETLGYGSVGVYFSGYVLFVVFSVMVVDKENLISLGLEGVDMSGLSMIRVDVGGVSLLYHLGGGGLLLCAWALLLTLLVVLELTRGLARGGLRAV